MPLSGPLPDSYWVIPGKLLAGDHPGLYPDRTKARVGCLTDAGISCTVDSSSSEASESYGRGLPGRRFAIREMMVPSDGKMSRILDVVDEEMEKGAVYVHCRAGLGRTGVVVGCFLVRHGMDGESALTEIRRLRSQTAQAWKPSPETESQRQMVRGWKTGQ